MKYIRGIIVVLAVCCAAWSVSAQDEVQLPTESPLSDIPAPSDPAELFDPVVSSTLQALWEANEAHIGSPFTANTNASILSQPSGFDVFMISVADVRAAEQSSSSVTVEGLVFNDAHHIGQTPLTLSLPAQDYVLAVRSTKRADGFDGDCVRQFTRDPITGGRRYDYHLYPLKKERSKYLCFIANFLTEGFSDEETMVVEESDGLFSISEAELMTALGSSCQAKVEFFPRIAKSLLEHGVAFYNLDGQPYIVKLSLSGIEPVIKEWPIEPDGN